MIINAGNYKIENGLIFCDKPAQSSEFIKELEQQVGHELYFLDDLDIPLTGASVLAPSFAKQAEILQNSVIKKSYVFLTSSISDFDTSKMSLDQTQFFRTKRTARFEKWTAVTENANAREICEQAAILNLPVLGAESFGGGAFPHFCLHLSDISISGNKTWTSFVPTFFDRMNLLRDSPLIAILSALDSKQRTELFLQSRRDVLDLLESLPEHEGLNGEIKGSDLQLTWKKPTAPTETDRERLQFLADFLNKNLALQV